MALLCRHNEWQTPHRQKRITLPPFGLSQMGFCTILDHHKDSPIGSPGLNMQSNHPSAAAAKHPAAAEDAGPRRWAWQRSRATLLAIAVLAIICIIWLRSYWRADLVAFFAPSGTVYSLASVNGFLVFIGTSIVVDPERAMALQWESTDPAYATNQAHKFLSAGAVDDSIRCASFASGSSPVEGLRGRWFVVRVSYWLLTVPSILVVLCTGRRQWIGRQRRKSGCCVRCGYDLRGSGASCPECGTATDDKDMMRGRS